MRVLVEILHPAHVHFFRNAIEEWNARGDEVLVLSRDKDIANDLLREYNIPFESISRIPKRKWQLPLEMLRRDFLMWRRARAFRPDVLVGIMGVTIAQVGKLVRKPAIVFYDTENATVTNRFVYPLAHSVCTPESYSGHVNGNHVKYPSYHELAYLHPNRFTPNAEVVRKNGVDPNASFFVLRFVSWQASHDVGESGFDVQVKRDLVTTLSQYGRVLITSEAPLPQDLESFRFTAPASDMHHFLAFAKMMIGESATMASEAAVLGTPAFYIADTGRGYTDEQQSRFGLTWTYRRAEARVAMRKIRSLLDSDGLQTQVSRKRELMLNERIDATSWLLDYIDSIAQA